MAHVFSMVLAVLGAGVIVQGQSLVPEQDIVLPASESAADPLKLLGANSPYYKGPNVYGISSDVPEGCTAEQAAYVVRHGSRYPDSGAYKQWVALYEKIQNASFTASGSLAFLSAWEPVLRHPKAQIAQESITGYKESHDLGFDLRVKYPDFYVEGTPFNVWANLYPRVVQTAKMFLRGYLGAASETLGTVVTVNSTGSVDAVGDSLAPSDSCPLFDDDSGGDYATTFDDIYLPPIVDRLNALLKGNLTLDADDVSLFPYLCGFESQIVGKLSPFCGVFTDAELEQYEYRQDLRYYYGVGPGTELEQLMMVPFLNSLVGILAEGPGVTGVLANGSTFTLPKLIMNFLNDGQITELVAALGIFDDQVPLPADEVLANRAYISSHFVSMRGTVTFERLNCIVASDETTGGSTTSSGLAPSPGVASTSTLSASSALSSASTFVTSTKTSCLSTPTFSTKVKETKTSFKLQPTPQLPGPALPLPFPAEPNGTPAQPPAPAWPLPPSPDLPPALSPAGSGGIPAQPQSPAPALPLDIPPAWNLTGWNMSHPAHSHSPNSPHNNPRAESILATTNQTFIRILLNDAIYPNTVCQDGPGSSCAMSRYVSLLAERYAASGNWAVNCNVTGAKAGTVVKGASFLTDLGLDWVDVVDA